MFSRLLRKRQALSSLLTYSLLLAFALIFGATSVFTYVSVHSMVMGEVSNQLQGEYRQLMADWESTGGDITRFLQGNASASKLQFDLFDASGLHIFSSFPFKEASLAQQNGISEVKIHDGGDEDGEFADHFLIYRTPLLKGDDSLILQIQKDLEDEDRFFFILKELLGVTAFIGFILVALISNRIAKRNLRPLDKIIRRAESMSAENLTERLAPSQSSDEVVRMTDAFNGMLSRLEDSFARQQRFVSDASHELRTPLSVIQGYTTMLQRWAKEDPALLDEGLEAIRAESTLMKNLADRLLLLAKSDTGGLTVNPSRLELMQVLKEIVHAYAAAGTPRVKISGESEPVTIEGDPDMIRQLLRNLIDNGLKFSPSDSPILLSITENREDHTCSISVQDQGVGIAEEHIPLLFDRFFRVDSSREREMGGAGIGLALAKEICDAHHAEISVQSKRGKGSTFTVNFPT